MPRRFSLLCALLWLCTTGVPASAHVGSSESVNNRYYKLTPMGDRLRLAYTIFFGREPGMMARRQMDKNRDGQLSSSEVKAYLKLIGDELFKSVSVELDGVTAKIRWQDADLGLGTAATSGGPFSVDFVGAVCLASRQEGHEHNLLFREYLRLPTPGESELHLDPAPGIRVTASELDGQVLRGDISRWQGGPGPAQRGYRLAFVVDSDETSGIDSLCEAPASGSGTQALFTLLGAGAGLAVLAIALWRKRQRASGMGQEPGARR